MTRDMHQMQIVGYHKKLFMSFMTTVVYERKFRVIFSSISFPFDTGL